MKHLISWFCLLVLLSACARTAPVIVEPTSVPAQSSKTPSSTSQSIPTTRTPIETGGGAGCQLTPIVRPTKPAVVPPSTQLDETVGLHMTGIPQELDLASYRLVVSGLVDRPLSLTLDELRCLPKVTAAATLNCIGVFVDSATWSGTPLIEVLNLAGLQSQMKSVVLTGADGYSATIVRDQAINRENFLAYEQQGRPLPVLHGFPLRGVFPNLPGSFWVKWLVEIKAQ